MEEIPIVKSHCHHELGNEKLLFEIGPGEKPVVKDVERGHYSFYLAGDIHPDSLGMEPDPTVISSAVTRLNITDHNFLNSTDLDDTADTIVLFNVLSYMCNAQKTTKREILSKMTHILKESGTILIGEWYTPDWASDIFSIDFSEIGLKFEVFKDQDGSYSALRSIGIAESRAQSIARAVSEKSGSGSDGKPFLVVLKKQSK